MLLNSRIVLALLLFSVAHADPLYLPFSDTAAPSVKSGKYGALGDGRTDDTYALRKALSDGRSRDSVAKNVDFYSPRPKLVYFPAGTFLISDTLALVGQSFTIQGRGVGATVIRIADNCVRFGSAASPRAAFFTMGGNHSFRINFFDLTINTGSGNPGAIGINYISNNVGCIENVAIVSGAGSGLVGLDMTRQWPGPCLVRNLEVNGFEYGIKVANSEYGPTFENITLVNQSTAGLYNDGNICAIHGLNSSGAQPAIVNAASWGYIILLDGLMQGGNPGGTAINNAGYVYLRNVTAQGFGFALASRSTDVPNSPISEYASDSVVSLFPSPQHSLRLPVEATPVSDEGDSAQWAAIDGGQWYGDTRAWTAAFTSGKSTVWFRPGVYLCSLAVDVPPTVKRVIGFGAQINKWNDGCTAALTLRVSQMSPDPLVVERFNGGVTIDHACARPVALCHAGYDYHALNGAGRLYLEDVGVDDVVLRPGQKVWARQLNTEGPDLHLTNNGAWLWVLGIKTEGKGTAISTLNSGATELLGTLLYPCQSFAAADGPAFINNESSVSLIYRVSSYVTNGNYPVQVRETRDGVTREYRPAVNAAGIMPLYVGYKTAAVGLGFMRVIAGFPVPRIAKAIALSDGWGPRSPGWEQGMLMIDARGCRRAYSEAWEPWAGGLYVIIGWP